MKKAIGLILFLSMLTACVPPAILTAPATPLPSQVLIEHAQIIYYDVTGSTANELRESMNKFRPKDPYDNNNPVDSYTDLVELAGLWDREL